jgi:LytS/YehU family sensor histidine kinase
MTLEYRTEHTISLEQELQLVKTYVEIEKTRFQDRLNVEYEIDQTLSEAAIPCMILQPLVENSIRHRVELSETDTNITIVAKQFDENLELCVRDTGVVLPSPRQSTGTGLNNLKLRLEKLYGERAQLKIDQMPPDGFEVKILLPLICESR